MSPIRLAAGRGAQAHDRGADRHAVRSCARQSSRADEHVRRTPQHRRAARGRKPRREAVPGDLRAAGRAQGRGQAPMKPMKPARLLPFVPAHRLAARAEEKSWLVDELWSDQAVGLIGGEPKCCKSFLALDMAVSVAAGTPCLRRFRVVRRGRVLLYAAEDALHAVRERIDGIARAAGVELQALDIQVITAPSLRIDQGADRARLEETIAALEP